MLEGSRWGLAFLVEIEMLICNELILVEIKSLLLLHDTNCFVRDTSILIVN